MSVPGGLILRLGTRGSLLAMRQSGMIANEITSRNPGLEIQTVVIKTSGDEITDRPLHDAGGKGLFVKELELALLNDRIDFAVHSCKDVPVTMPVVDESKLMLGAIPPRHDARDVLVSAGARSIAELERGARIGTGSLRRRCQLHRLRPDLHIGGVRGNIDTRLKKLRSGEFDALVLAMAGVQRSGLFDHGWMHPIPVDELIPAPGQGALALQCRREDAQCRRALQSVDDAPTRTCVTAERQVVAALKADCHSPIGAFAKIDGAILRLKAAVGARDGAGPVLTAAAESPILEVSGAVDSVIAQLTGQGAMALLHG